jgi:hypothetical protein
MTDEQLTEGFEFALIALWALFVLLPIAIARRLWGPLD